MADAGRVRELDRTGLSPMRRITLRRLREAQQEAVPVTVQSEADAEALVALRARPGGIGLTAVLAGLLARTLAAHPDVNCGLDGEELVRYADVNLGVAVALEDGNLSVPVVPRAQALAAEELAAAIADRAARARAGALGLDDVRGGTFTLSNVGMLLPAVWGTPLIPLGQAGVLLTGGPVARPVVRDGAVVPGHVLPLSLTFDHRIVNGAPALRFLRDLVAAVQQGAADAA